MFMHTIRLTSFFTFHSVINDILYRYLYMQPKSKKNIILISDMIYIKCRTVVISRGKAHRLEVELKVTM